jgi:hypothetical protein
MGGPGAHARKGPTSTGHGATMTDNGLEGWFTVEPQGAVNFHLNFGQFQVHSCLILPDKTLI